MPIQGFAVDETASSRTDHVALDDTQWAVLATGDSTPVAVLGAPGTGKTTTLIELVADRVHSQGFAPDEILVLAATRASATDLRDRIATRIAVPTGGPMARTANSVAFQIVRGISALTGTDASSPAAAIAGDGPRLLTGGEQDQMIAELIRGDIDDGTGPEWPELLGPDVRALRGFRTQLRDLMARCVEYGVSPARLASLGRAAGRPEWVAAADFIQGYDEVKMSFRERHFDSSELMQEAAAALRALPPGQAGHAAIGALAGLRLVIVDDAQEATRATMSLVREFHARGCQIIAFGDPDISTGTFRGARADVPARLGRYLTAERDRPVPVQTLYLGLDHRRGDDLVALHRRVTEHIGAVGAVRQRHVSASPAAARSAHGQDGVSLSCVQVTSPADELAVIARHLREHHVFGKVPWQRMAVIVRSHRAVPGLTGGLAALEVPTHAPGPGRALRDDPAVQAFVLALDVALARRELTAESAARLLGGPLGGLDAVALRRVKAALRLKEFAAEGTRGADELLVRAIQHPDLLTGIDTTAARRAGRLAESLAAAGTEADAGASIEELLWGLWQRSRLADRWYEQSFQTGIAADEANHNLDAVVALFSAAKRFVERSPDAPATNFLEQLTDTDVPEDTLAPRALAPSVTITTPTGAIGQEYDVVVIAGLQEGVWPNLRVRGSLLGAEHLAALAAGDAGLEEAGAGPHADDPGARAQVLHDELRMFAQAASRARRELLITAVADEDSVPSPLFRLLPEPHPALAQRPPLSLRGLVGRLRRDLVEHGTRTDAASRQQAQQAADALARLARAEVPGAHPGQWYGVPPVSSTAPLVDLDAPGAVVPVSPSAIQAFEACPLHWLLGRITGSAPSAAQSIGTLLHSALEMAEDHTAEGLWRGVSGRWAELTFDSDWESRLRRNAAEEMTGRLASYLRDFETQGGGLIGAELTFELAIPLTSGEALLRGAIDRVERYPDGTVVIVDLKTGKSEPTSDAQVADHPQLAAYQLAFAEHALEVPDSLASGGAKLVIISSGTRAQNYRAPHQRPLDQEQLDAFRARVADNATGMAGQHFEARIGSHCFDPYSGGQCRVHVIKAVSA